MVGLSLLDAVAVLFVLFRTARARTKALGESLHALIALLLIIGLFLGFRMTRELRALLGEAADLLQAIPGLGTKLLVIVGAWYLMRMLRSRTGTWLERAIPARQHSRLLPMSEGLRAVLLVGFVAWLAEGWFAEPPQTVPHLIGAVRTGDAWLEQQVSPD